MQLLIKTIFSWKMYIVVSRIISGSLKPGILTSQFDLGQNLNPKQGSVASIFNFVQCVSAFGWIFCYYGANEQCKCLPYTWNWVCGRDMDLFSDFHEFLEAMPHVSDIAQNQRHVAGKITKRWCMPIRWHHSENWNGMLHCILKSLEMTPCAPILSVHSRVKLCWRPCSRTRMINCTSPIPFKLPLRQKMLPRLPKKLSISGTPDHYAYDCPYKRTMQSL